MEFGFSDEQLLLQKTLRQYAKSELLPNYHRWDRGEKFPREKILELGQLGILGLRAPERFGGQDASFVAGGIASEELSRGDFNYSQFIQLSAIAAELLRENASPEVQAEWLPRLASGEALFAFALTEPAVGSDAANLTTRAVKQGDEYVITGEKASITLGGFADVAIVFARTGEAGARGISAFLVPLDRPGITRQVYQSPGERLSARGSLFFDGTRIPARFRLGEEREGFHSAMVSFDFNRAFIALACVGAALQSLDETVEYTKTRQAFGRPLAKFEGVSFQVAEQLTVLEGARLIAYKCLWLKDQGLPHTKESAMSKWLGPKVSVEAIHACILLHGHYGYNQESPLEQRLRDVIGLEIGDGTPEIMKGIVAREVYGREYMSYR
ncbi:MAG: acyl-CoA dehydrogenase family protein [Candidatus Rokubacteria bacterium]|nr:acyl-CoA dehydrogenase family protein [Candidatus Rokubacteria bacterium]